MRKIQSESAEIPKRGKLEPSKETTVSQPKQTLHHNHPRSGDEFNRALNEMLTMVHTTYDEAERMIGYNDLVDFVIDAGYNPEFQSIDASLMCDLPETLDLRNDKYWNLKFKGFLDLLDNEHDIKFFT